MSEFKNNDAVFLQRLTSLLNSEVRVKTKEAEEADELYERLRWEIYHCFEEAMKLDALPDFSFQDYKAKNVDFPIDCLKEQTEKPWLKDKLTVGLLGHFSSGKTTALNLILTENLPTNENENTALAAYLVHGVEGEMSIVTKSGQTLLLKEEDSRALDYANGKKKFPFARIFDYVVKENKSTLLENLTLIDTPGLGKNLQHSEPTKHALQSCDSVIWFVKVPDSISTGDIKFIQENIGERTLFVVLSFVDDCENPDKAIAVIKKSFSKAKIAVEDYFLLGDSSTFQATFRQRITASLEKAAVNYKPYNPVAHLFDSLNSLDKAVESYQKFLLLKYHGIEKLTDALLDSYNDSLRKFEDKHNCCRHVMKNIIDHFNNHCSSAFFCGNTSDTIYRFLKLYNDHFSDMTDAYNEIDTEKLVQYGEGRSRMKYLEDRSDKCAAILGSIHEIIKIFH